MKAKNCLIFGGSGQIGRNLIRKLTKNNYQVTVVTRNIHQKSYIIKTQANAGYIDIVESNIFEEQKFRKLFEKADICVNLIGILFESKKGNTFKNIHTVFPSLLSKLSKEYKLKHFIHLSALGINEATDSDYAKSKLEGEERILKNFPLATIIRPSIVYSVDDNFTTNFMTLLNRLPIFPLYYEGKTKFAPIHCSDLTDVIFNVIFNNVNSKIIECVGPEIISFKEILEKLLNLIGKKRLLIPMPLPLAQLSARFFEIMPKPVLTRDQLKLLKYDNVLSGKYKSNSDMGVPSLKYFDEEVKKYCYMWREGGQFSTEKYNSDNIDIKTS
ncbi:complex I NDUFA9 subunit family protein [Candidatus Pelagibacter sp. HIMB1493]|uniref:complex I NDUFA9 subunit family protein n=1 Tax=Candidatus Pelagibacter sp. HIMB1493 TaxID=3413334 RepID=UPI003F854235